MKIPIEADVFPNLKFCESEHGSTCCDYLDPAKAYDTTQCGLFRKDGKSIILRSKERREIKCDECKEVYQKALKKKEPQDPDHSPAKETGENCDFDCEERGIKIPEGELTGDCKKCIYTPPF